MKQYVIDFFKNYPTGRFLEIGADDGGPRTDSEPFWGLIEQGWSGVYCEPNPMACTKLIKHAIPYGDKIKIFNGGIASSAGIKDFFISIETSGSSSFYPNWMQRQHFYLPEHTQFPIITNTLTLSSLLDYTGWDFDAISVDIECKGNIVEEIFNDIDISKLVNCKLIILEVATTALETLLIQHGFLLDKRYDGNLVFTKTILSKDKYYIGDS